jgi:hypothetical protein
MASRQVIHNDVDLRHVALMPWFNKQTKMYDLKPILIDMTRVTHTTLSEAEKAAQVALAHLQNQLLDLNSRR